MQGTDVTYTDIFPPPESRDFWASLALMIPNSTFSLQSKCSKLILYPISSTVKLSFYDYVGSSYI